ncbi:MAG: acyltransferase [Phycisphaerales bacterium]|nr:MAG: acyltransferase [Phycisphaerales bacterium]
MKTPSCLTSDAEPANASRLHRIANIERLRVLSVCAVVSLHTHSWFPHSPAFTGLIILLLVLCVFVVNRPEPYEFTFLVRQKGERLLKPWLFWSVVYGALRLAKVIYMDVPFSEVFSATMFLTGTRIHLWFLPFGFVAAILLGLLYPRITKVSDVFGIVTVALVGALCVLGCAILQSRVSLPTPLIQWTLGLPAIPLGLAIGRANVLPNHKDRRNLYLLIVLSIAVAYVAYTALTGLQYSIWFDHGSKYTIRYCTAVAVVCSALHWQGRMDRVSKTLGPLSYGIYLVHPLIIIVIYRTGILEGHPLALLCLILAASILITFVLKKTQLRQFI